MPLPRTTVEPKFRLVFGSILTLNWITGLILASCFFMPLAVGCQNTVIYPTELAVNSFKEQTAVSAIELLHASAHACWMARPYLYGLVLATVTIAATLVGGKLGRTLINRGLLAWSTLAVLVLAGLGLAGLIEAEANRDGFANHGGLLEALGYAAGIGLPPLAVLVVQIRLTRLGRHWTAITTGEIGWAILCGLRFGVWLDPRQLLIGGKISLAACIVLVELARLQHYHARSVFESDTPPRKFQFSTRYLFALMFAAALFLTWVLDPDPR